MDRSIESQIQFLVQRKMDFKSAMNDQIDHIADAFRLLLAEIRALNLAQMTTTPILNTSGTTLSGGMIVGYDTVGKIAKSKAGVEGVDYVLPVYIVPAITAPGKPFRPVADELQRMIVTGDCSIDDPLWLSTVAGTAQVTKPTGEDVVMILVGIAASEKDSTGTALVRRDPGLSPGLSIG